MGSSPAGRGGGGASAAGAKKESILELQKLLDASVRVKCVGGRELEGILRGYDDLVNLVLDDCEEYVRGTVTMLADCPCPSSAVTPLTLTTHFVSFHAVL